MSCEEVVLTPSDLTYKGLNISEVEELERVYDLEDVYPLSPMQEGMLFHSLLDQEADHYFRPDELLPQGGVGYLHAPKELPGFSGSLYSSANPFPPRGL